MGSFAGLGHSAGSLLAAGVVVHGIRSALPKKKKLTSRFSYLRQVSLQTKRMRSGKISIGRFKKNMASFRKINI